LPNEDPIASETIVGLDERLIHILKQSIGVVHIEELVQSADAASCDAMAEGVLAQIERHTSLTDPYRAG